MTEMSEELSGKKRLAGGYRHALTAADVFFGAFVILMVAIAAISWLRGDAPLTDLLMMVAFLFVNIVLSEISRRSGRPDRIEHVRMVVGGIVTTAGYLIVRGPLAPWWPGFMVLSLGGAIGFGLLRQKPHWGRIAVAYYLSLFVGAELYQPKVDNGYAFALQIGIVATIGLMFAEIMSLLGKTLQQEYAQGLKLKEARDALFSEMEVAQDIQTLLLPKAPKLTDAEVAGRMLTATEVGGDYYDVIESRHGRTLLAIGDVSGHGVTSGLTMMMARTALIGAIESRPEASLYETYRVLNSCVRESLERMGLAMYMTFGLFEYHGHGRYTAVGRHLPVLIYRQNSKTIEEVELKGYWLGVVDELPAKDFEETQIELQHGDLLFLYTDGIVEHAGADGEMFGDERLHDAIVEYAPQGSNAVIEGVVAALKAYSPMQDDDVTMLVVSYTGAAQAGAAA